MADSATATRRLLVSFCIEHSPNVHFVDLDGYVSDLPAVGGLYRALFDNVLGNYFS
jgi:hypothetical protein